MPVRPSLYKPVVVSPVVVGEKAQLAADQRRKRLHNYRPIRIFAYLTDVVLSFAIPLLVGIGIAAVAVYVLERDTELEQWVRDNVYSEQVLNSLGVMQAFIISSRLNANLNKNNVAIAHFSSLAGGCVNAAIWTRSMVTNSVDMQTVTLPDGFGGFYSTTEMGLILASIPYIVKYTFRQIPVRFEELPLGSVPSLLAQTRELTNPSNGRSGLNGFTACVVLTGERIDKWEANGSIKPPELVSLFGQLNAIAADEGAIAGAVAYDAPGAITFLLYVSFFVYFVLLIVGDVAPKNSWNSLWIAAIIIVSNFGLYAIGVRYRNPFAVRTVNSTQRPIISHTCRETEVAIDAVFKHPRRPHGSMDGSVVSLSLLSRYTSAD